jgi:Fe-S oxidoreductase
VAEIEDGSRVSPLLVNALETLYRFGNPWEPSKRKRSEWPNGLDVPDITAGAQAALCYFVGCTTSFDTRAQKLARAFVRILHHAGVEFGTLGQKEGCCGDIARRVGEDGLFEEQVEKTQSLLDKYGVTDLVTSSPHCFNLLKNEYPEPAPAVRHYTQVLDELVGKGLLASATPRPLTVTYHDPCYLGRYNHIYEAPRRVLGSIPGVRLVEMAHTGSDSLCCGGGGGRMWQELDGEQKLSEVRIREAAATGADVVVTACPYCLIMLEDAVKTADLEGRLRVMDMNELVAESLGLGGEED